MTKISRGYRLPIFFGIAGVLFCLPIFSLPMTTGLCLMLLAAGGAAVIRMRELGRFPLLRQMLLWAMLLCVTILTVASSQIALFADAAPVPWEEGWAVVLGAHVQPDGSPSSSLKERLDAALVFHKENPQIPMILSGSKGDDEPFVEADAMYAYLQQNGADMNGIYRETKARTTLENLRYSRELADELGFDGGKVTIISSEFHLFRAVYLAERLGLEPGTVAAVTRAPFYRINYMLREVFSMVKAAVQTANLS